jgi:hypothetical protein
MERRREQMTNSDHIFDLDRERGRSSSPWRGIGGIAASLVARAEARQIENLRPDTPEFIPVAWAAE